MSIYCGSWAGFIGCHPSPCHHKHAAGIRALPSLRGTCHFLDAAKWSQAAAQVKLILSPKMEGQAPTRGWDRKTSETEPGRAGEGEAVAAASDGLGCCHWDNAGPEWDVGRKSSASSAVRAGWVLKAKLQDLKESSCNRSHFTKNS